MRRRLARLRPAARLCVGLCLGLSAALAGCAAEQPAPPAEDAAPLHKQLPPGAILEEPRSQPPRDVDTEDLAPSVPADDSAPIPRIEKRGRLIVGVDQAQYLLSFQDPVHGEQRGFEVDIAREIARDIFGDPQAVQFRYVDSTNRMVALQNGTVDIVIRSVSITRNRQEQTLFSTPYLDTYTRLAVRRGSGITSPDDVGERTICTTGNSISVEEARRHAPDAPKLVARNWTDCLLALQQHQADAIIGDDRILAGIRAQDPFVEVLPDTMHHDHYGVAAARENEGIIKRVNATLERIHADGTWQNIYSTWFVERVSR